MLSKPLVWKFLIIIAVAVGAFFSAYPPEDRIALGLDLRGGAHILMRVDTEAALGYQIDLETSRLGQQLEEAGLSRDSIPPIGNSGMELKGTDPARRDEVREILDTSYGNWDIVDAGSGNWRVTMPLEAQTFYKTSAVDMTLETLRKRIDGLGVSEPLVQKQGLDGDRILIQLPGVEDPERIKDILKDPAILEWKEVSYPASVSDTRNWTPPADQAAVVQLFGGTLPEDTELYPQDVPGRDGTDVRIWWPLKRVSTVIGQDLRNAFRSQDEWGDPAVSFELTQEAGRRFEAATRKNLGRRMAIVLGGKDEKRVISAPTINGVIRDQGIIQGGFGLTEAEDLSLKLRSGAIPTEVSIIEERTVGPSLGRTRSRPGCSPDSSASRAS